MPYCIFDRTLRSLLMPFSSFLGTWEMIHNPNFKVVEFDHFRMQVGLPTQLSHPYGCHQKPSGTRRRPPTQACIIYAEASTSQVSDSSYPIIIIVSAANIAYFLKICNFLANFFRDIAYLRFFYYLCNDLGEKS